jgi:hypothetical protein
MLQTIDLRETRDGAREIKFLVASDRSELLRAWARAELRPDPHGGGADGSEYQTTTIYLDTRDRAVYRRVGSYGRSKFRVRRYGMSETVFLERKLRTSALLSKRRTAVAASLVPEILTGPPGNGVAAWFSERVSARGLEPTCQVSYRRHAFIGTTEHGPMRLTFDDCVQAHANGTHLFDPSDRSVGVLTGHLIVEMKFCMATPTVFKRLVEEFRLTPVAVSKYRAAIDALAASIAPCRSQARVEVAAAPTFARGADA